MLLVLTMGLGISQSDAELVRVRHVILSGVNIGQSDVELVEVRNIILGEGPIEAPVHANRKDSVGSNL